MKQFKNSTNNKSYINNIYLCLDGDGKLLFSNVNMTYASNEKQLKEISKLSDDVVSLIVKRVSKINKMK